MDIKGKRIMIFGGWGLVGQAIAKQLLEEQPSEMIVTSLRKNEAKEIQDILNMATFLFEMNCLLCQKQISTQNLNK